MWLGDLCILLLVYFCCANKMTVLILSCLFIIAPCTFIDEYRILFGGTYVGIHSFFLLLRHFP